MNQPKELEGMIFIPAEALQRDTLIGLIEEFVTREGTDYGHQEQALTAKIQSIERLLASGDAVIVFDAINQNTNILTRAEADKLVSFRE